MKSHNTWPKLSHVRAYKGGGGPAPEKAEMQNT